MDAKEILFDKFNIPKKIAINKREQFIIDKFYGTFAEFIKEEKLISGIAFCQRPIVCGAYLFKKLVDLIDSINRTMPVEDALKKYYSMYYTNGDDLMRLSSLFGLNEDDKKLRSHLFRHSVLIIVRPEFILNGTRPQRAFFIEVVQQRIEKSLSTIILSGETKNKFINISQDQSGNMIKILKDENMRTIG